MAACLAPDQIWLYATLCVIIVKAVLVLFKALAGAYV